MHYKRTNILFILSIAIFIAFLILIGSLLSLEIASLDDKQEVYHHNSEYERQNDKIQNCEKERIRVDLNAEFLELDQETNKAYFALWLDKKVRCADILKAKNFAEEQEFFNEKSIIITSTIKNLNRNSQLKDYSAKRRIDFDTSGEIFLYPLDRYTALIGIEVKYPDLSNIEILPTGMHLIHGKNSGNVRLQRISKVIEQSSKHKVVWQVQYTRSVILQFAGIVTVVILISLMIFNIIYSRFIVKKRIQGVEIHFLWAIFNIGILFTIYQIFPFIYEYKHSLISYILHFSILISQLIFIFVCVYSLVQKMQSKYY